MKSSTFLKTEGVSETYTQRSHVPLHQITGDILHKYTDNRGNSAYLVQKKRNVAIQFGMHDVSKRYLSALLCHTYDKW